MNNPETTVVPADDIVDEDALAALSSKTASTPAAPITDPVLPDPSANDGEQPTAEAATPTETQVPFPKSRRTPVLHALTSNWSVQPKPESLLKPREMITLPTVAAERMDEIVNDMRNFDLVDPGDLTAWTKSYEQGGRYYPRLNRWSAAVNRPGSEFMQAIPGPNGPMEIRSPKIGHDANDPVRSGAKAVSYIRASMGMGTIRSIPLFASGFWVSIKAAPDGELLELYRRLSESKIDLGRATGGLIYSNTRAFTTALLVDFVIDHIFDHTISAEQPDLASLISISDIPALITGMASVTYPTGFHYSTQCMAAPEECHAIIEQKAVPEKMLWHDYRQLSEAQIKHMSRSRGRTMSIESIKDYQKGFGATSAAVVDMGEGVKVHLKMPSVKEYENIGAEWINSTITMVNAALGLEVADGTRNAYITKQSSATTLRQYQHYISHIESPQAIVDTQEGIAALLADFSGFDNHRQTIFDAVGVFIDANAVTSVCTTDYKCPSCGKLQNDHSSHDPSPQRSVELIPINAEMVFFTLLAQKDQLVALR